MIVVGDTTHRYLARMGAKVARDKCGVFSTCKATRRKFRKHVWRWLDHAIKVQNDARDLGAHMSFGTQMIAGTLLVRVGSAAAYASHIGSLPLAHAGRLRIYRGKVVPKAIFGAEVTPFTTECRRIMGAAVKKAVHVGNDAMTNVSVLAATW
eukprot:620433-Alexandrium_andersonii.AAC.1